MKWPIHLYHSIHVKPCMWFLCSAGFHRLEPQLKETKLKGKPMMIAREKKNPQKPRLPSSYTVDKQAPPNFTVPCIQSQIIKNVDLTLRDFEMVPISTGTVSSFEGEYP